MAASVLTGRGALLNQFDYLLRSQRRVECKQFRSQVGNVRRRHGSARKLELRSSGNIAFNIVTVCIHRNCWSVAGERRFIACLVHRTHGDQIRQTEPRGNVLQKAGITVVRVGESTWSSWEPRDGDFQFAWMQRVLDRLHQAGIKAILGTPTYSIPTWLYKEHPEILVTHAGTAPPLSDSYDPSYPSELTPGYYGIRQNYDFLNPYFRQHAERMARLFSHSRIPGVSVRPVGGAARVAMPAAPVICARAASAARRAR